MRSSAARDAMIARVAEAFAKWPSFSDLPQTKAVGRRIQLNGDPDDQQCYINALNACCYEGAPAGRDGMAIVVEPVAHDDDELVARSRVHRMKAAPGGTRQNGASMRR